MYIIAVGLPGSGKTELVKAINRDCNGSSFKQSYARTISVDTELLNFENLGNHLMLGLPGHCRYQSIARAYYRAASICLYVHDVSRQFDPVHYQDTITELHKDSPKCRIIFITTGIDKSQRAYSAEQGLAFAKKYADKLVCYQECSNKTEPGLKELRHAISLEIAALTPKSIGLVLREDQKDQHSLTSYRNQYLKIFHTLIQSGEKRIDALEMVLNYYIDNRQKWQQQHKLPILGNYGFRSFVKPIFTRSQTEKNIAWAQTYKNNPYYHTQHNDSLSDGHLRQLMNDYLKMSKRSGVPTSTHSPK